MNEVVIHIYSENETLQHAIANTIQEMFLKEMAEGAVQSVEPTVSAHCDEVKVAFP